MEEILFIDGIGDISIVKDFRANVPCNELLILALTLKKLGYKCDYIDGRGPDFSKAELVQTVINKNYAKVVIHTKWNNCSEMFSLASKFSGSSILFFYDMLLVKDMLNAKNVNASQCIYYNSKKSFQKNYESILKYNFNYEGSFIYEHDPEYWNFLDKNISYSYTVLAGRECEVDEIRNNTEVTDASLPVETIIKEISYLLGKGITYITLQNLNLCCDPVKLQSFTKSIKNIKQEDIVISCIFSYDILKGEVDAISALSDTNKINVIELQIDSINEEIQLFNRGENESLALLKTIEKLKGFTSILINYRIGFQTESAESLFMLTAFSTQILHLLPGIAEFTFSYYHDSSLSLLDPNQKLLLLKGYLINYNDNLPLDIIANFKSSFYNEIGREMRKCVKKLTSQQRINHTKLATNGVITQYYYQFLSKTNTELIRAMRMKNKNWKNSWEIKDNIFEYAVAFFIREHNLNGKKVILIDPTLFENSHPYIELSDFDSFIVNQAKRLISIEDIYLHSIELDFIDVPLENRKQYILDFFLKVEQYDVLLFLKLINKDI